MAHQVKTYKIDLGEGSDTNAAAFEIEVKGAPPEPILDIPISYVDFQLKPEKVGTELVSFPTDPKVVNIEIESASKKKVATYKTDAWNKGSVTTKAPKVGRPGENKRSVAVPCKPPRKMKVFESDYLEKTPITRFMLDQRKIPFPVISEYMGELANKNKTNYTNIRLIGVFDPIPMHLAEKLTLDPTLGILKFFIRKEPLGDRRNVRVVYGRLRTTGDIISAVFPVN
ncbi:MAG TPA: hypothetical protein PLQ76_07590 [bacterium]|nr:hypothetical protein [bacterium]